MFASLRLRQANLATIVEWIEIHFDIYIIVIIFVITIIIVILIIIVIILVITIHCYHYHQQPVSRLNMSPGV